ncbi:hypothetical protein [Flagellimonas onchidii]|uniref:hypothetical protein n=1 Tax=Flagellimonas onchidii TaxID=2562684 RepID=UPI0010A62EC5|nr:hypothetical protein [Allomuricauda onchidii]
MTKLYKINLVFVILTLVLYLTVYLGLLFSIVLGGVQVIMSLIMLYNFKKLSETNKVLFIIYLIPTATILVLIATDNYGDINYIMKFAVIPMMLAFLHLYITYRIKNEL